MLHYIVKYYNINVGSFQTYNLCGRMGSILTSSVEDHRFTKRLYNWYVLLLHLAYCNR
jgi:hypothetical protein